ncbi:glycosyltransferase [Motilibacter aurantiacus]|uniref:glycosyltransferase n=1 Tax=Motilibacter aurantiacus TaxID=2714955 RepID=UPI001407E7D5|nr:glycosyltransferase [Motilibacter aurantiacus]NHC47294.1 glycosyltransferase [Motilibacter aurantiacus]
MRVALVCGSYAPDRDGVADYVARLAEGLSAHGDVEPVVLSSAGATAECVRVCERWDLPGVRAAARRLGELAPDVVHVQFAPSAYGWSPAVGLLPLMLGRHTKAPVVTTLHEYGWWSWPRRVPAPVWRAVERTGWWDRETLALAPRSAALVTTNAGHAATVRSRLRREPVVVPIGPNVVDAGDGRDAARAAVTASLGLPLDARLLVFFGFVHPVKGVRYLLDALAELRADPAYADLHVVVAGGFTSLALPEDEARAFRAELEAHAAERGVAESVSFLGHTPAREVSRLLRAADAAVLPLTHGVTAKSGALIAALSHGAPVVMTLPEKAQDRSPELVDGRTVVTVAARRDGPALAAALRRVLADDALRARVAAGGRELAAGRGWPALAARHAELYATVAGAPVRA